MPKPVVVPDPVVVPVPGGGPAPFVVLPDEEATPKPSPAPAKQGEQSKPNPSEPNASPPDVAKPVPVTVQPQPEDASKKPTPGNPSRKPAPAPKAAPEIKKSEGDPAGEWVPDYWTYPPGKRPCNLIESGGPGLSKGGRYDKVYCRYLCGKRQTRRYTFWGNSVDVCLDPRNRPTW